MGHGERRVLAGTWAWIAAILPSAWAGAALGGDRGAPGVAIFRDAREAPIAFAAAEIRAALQAIGVPATERPLDEHAKAGEATGIILAVDAEAIRRRLRTEGGAPIGRLAGEGYAIRRTGRGPGRSCWAVGADPVGAMYAGLHVAEAVRLDRGLDALADATKAPFIPRRGIKFNIPLDARTPGYDDTGDAAQANIAPMWDLAFWTGFLDAMARHRYDTLTLWNPHPFPSLVKVPEYPDVALDDVCVTTLAPAALPGAWREPMHVAPVVLRHLRVVVRMTIDEKIALWRRVMRHARDRGIDVYVITWNVVVNGAEGKYGITAEQDNPATIAYLRASVRELILTYPLLAGIGVTAGENMRDLPGEYAREEWLWRAYGRGILDAKKVQPGRRVRFIHRVWQTGLKDIVATFGSRYPDPFELGFKYARAHMYASTRPPFSRGLCEALARHGLRCWWNLRNDDIFCFRWGDPDYARAFLRNLPPPALTAGYHMGSDGYVWGRTFGDLRPVARGRLEIEKHWYRFMLWGRLGYDPSLDRPFFERILASRFPGAPAAALYDAWAGASGIIPLVTRFHWRDWDFMWSVEGCMDQRQGFHTVEDFIRVRPLAGSGLLSIPDYAASRLAGRPAEGTTPIDVARELEHRARAALALVAGIRRRTPSPGEELLGTLADIEAMAHLGAYYAAKIRGAASLCLFRRSGEARWREEAVARLEEALAAWRRYAAAASSRYRPQLLARTRRLDWSGALDDVARDVEIARAARP